MEQGFVSRLNSPPARPLPTLRRCPHEHRRMTQGHLGSLPLRCRELSSPSSCRFIPATLRSKPAILARELRRVEPSAGSRPPSTRRSSVASTRPASPSSWAPTPSHSPRASPPAEVVILRAVADALDHVDTPLGLIEVVLGLPGRQLADREQRNVLRSLSRCRTQAGQAVHQIGAVVCVCVCMCAVVSRRIVGPSERSSGGQSVSPRILASASSRRASASYCSAS